MQTRTSPPHLTSFQSIALEVHGRTRRACPPFLLGSAEDIAQATLMRLLERRRQGQPLPLAYVRKAVTNAVRDAVRAHDRRKSLMERHRMARISQQRSHDETVHPDPLAKAALREALDQLDPQRRRIVMGYLAGTSMPEMARTLGWNPKKASNTLWRTLARLRRDLRAQGIERRINHHR